MLLADVLLLGVAVVAIVLAVLRARSARPVALGLDQVPRTAIRVLGGAFAAGALVVATSAVLALLDPTAVRATMIGPAHHGVLALGALVIATALGALAVRLWKH